MKVLYHVFTHLQVGTAAALGAVHEPRAAIGSCAEDGVGGDPSPICAARKTPPWTLRVIARAKTGQARVTMAVLPPTLHALGDVPKSQV